MSAGKKEFVKEAVKKQRRNLLDTLRNLHVQFTEQTAYKCQEHIFLGADFSESLSPERPIGTHFYVKHANIDFLIQLS